MKTLSKSQFLPLAKNTGNPPKTISKIPEIQTPTHPLLFQAMVPTEDPTVPPIKKNVM